MSLIPFLIPCFPNKKFFFKILKYLKIKKIKKIEIGFPYKYSYLDNKHIIDCYKKIESKFNFFKIIEKIKKEFKSFFKIILVSYYESILRIGEKKIFNEIKNKNIYKIIIIDLPYKIRKYIYRKLNNYIIYLVPYKRNNNFLKKKKSFYYHLDLNEKVKKKKIKTN
ncbi:tryptophan synthase subunit alpha [Candidatus Vidania fulgoroideorum]